MTNYKLLTLLVVCLFSLRPYMSEACTGITLKSRDGSTVVARTIEWGGSDLNSRYVIVPRGYVQQSLLPDGKKNGLVFTAQYGYVGMAVEQDEIVAEGINEAGLSAGLFYFPHYGQYETYDPAQKASSVADIQLVSWILGNFERIEDVQNAIKRSGSLLSIPELRPYIGGLPMPQAAKLFWNLSRGNPAFTKTNWGY